MSGIKVFLGGYSLLNTLQQTTTISLLKSCSVNSSSSSNKQVNPDFKALATGVGNDAGVASFLKSNSIQYAQGWHSLNVLSCPKADFAQFYVNKETGDFSCLKCSKNGDFADLKLLSRIVSEQRDCIELETESDRACSTASLASPAMTGIGLWREWLDSEPVQTLADGQFKIIVQNAQTELNFCKQTLARHEVRVFESSVLFPVYDLGRRLVDVVLLNVKDSTEERASLVISRHVTDVSTKTRRLYITDSVLNMLAIEEHMSETAIVVRSVGDLSQPVLATLEKYNEIVFWQRDKQLSFELARLLNVNRCSIVAYTRSSYEAHMLNEVFGEAVTASRFSLKDKAIISFGELEGSVREELSNAKLYAGVQWSRYMPLNRILKGHRRAELTIFTGSTGSGKTTFLGEYSLDLAAQGVTTLWGSFEIKNSRLAKMLITQFAKLDLTTHTQLFDHVAQQFRQLPFFFMNFHGEHTLDNVLQTMAKSVILHDVRHVIIDNLQFMLGSQGATNSKMDKYTYQDHVISAFRRFATDFDCHVTVVIHPRKEESDLLLKMSSIFGSAKATQEADNIFILQAQNVVRNDRSIRMKFIEVVKNRYDGELGKFLLKFNKECLCFTAGEVEGAAGEEVDETTSKILKISDSMFEDIKLNLAECEGDYGPFTNKPS